MNDAPEQKPTQKQQEQKPPRKSGGFSTFVLGLGLTAALLVAVAGYLWLSPDPDRRPRPAPQSAMSGTPENVLRFVAPRSVIEPDLLRDFETETGLKVELVSYDNEETLLPATAAAPLNGDVILASGATIQALRAKDRINILPVRAIGHLGAIDPALRTVSSGYDSDGLHAAPFAWTVYGLGVNREAVAAQLGRGAAVDTWGLVFDPELAAKLSACGIHSVAAPSVAFPLALKYLGLPPKSDAPVDTERASALWETTRAFTAKFETRSIEEGLAGGQACVALASAADVHRAKAQARAAGQTFTIDFALPQEGTILRLYMLALPRASAKTEKGASLIDYLLRPEVSARMTNSRGLANAMPGSEIYLRQEIKDDPGIYPDIAAFSRLTPEANPSPATLGLRERFWQLMNAAGKGTGK